MADNDRWQSWYDISESSANGASYDIDNAIFRRDKDGCPYLQGPGGVIVWGLKDNHSYEKLYKESGSSSMSLDEFTLRTDFVSRFSKQKLTRRFRCHKHHIVVEAGAYLGYHAMKTAMCLEGTGKVVAIEMDPHNFRVLQKNLEQNFPGIGKAVHAAIHASDGVHPAYLGGAQVNGLRADVIGRRTKETIQVQTSRLDTILNSLGLPHIDLLSLQLNGTEAGVLGSLGEWWGKVENFAIAANYDISRQYPIRHQIADLFVKNGLAVEVLDNWVYAKKMHDKHSYNRAVANPIFIGGCGRSGTTLLRMMVDSHRNISCGPESNLFSRQEEVSFARLAFKFDLQESEVVSMALATPYLPHFAELLLSAYAARNGKPRWADKTPRNVRVIPYLFDNFPNARFIHVIRDGRDVACSLRAHPKYKIVDGTRVETNIRRPFEKCVQRWVEDTASGLAWRNDPRYLEIRYEDLVRATPGVLRKVFDFVEEPWDEGVLQYYAISGRGRDPLKFPQNEQALQPVSEASIGKWTKEMTSAEVALFKKMGNHRLVELGYERDGSW